MILIFNKDQQKIGLFIDMVNKKVMCYTEPKNAELEKEILKTDKTKPVLNIRNKSILKNLIIETMKRKKFNFVQELEN